MVLLITFLLTSMSILWERVQSEITGTGSLLSNGTATEPMSADQEKDNEAKLKPKTPPSPPGKVFHASGVFVAQKACPTFPSILDSRNIENHFLFVSHPYEILAVNASSSPTKVQITKLPTIRPDRWVDVSCGKLDRLEIDVSKNLCSSSVSQNYFRLTLNWSPHYCATTGSADCSSHATVQNPQFAFKALSVEKYGCQHKGGWCSSVQLDSTVKDFPEESLVIGDYCSLPEISPKIPAETLEALTATAIPGFTAACLHRKAWFKYGNCLPDDLAISPDVYFSLPVSLVKSLNQGKSLQNLLLTASDKAIQTTDFFAAFDKDLGKNAHKWLSLHCKSNTLTSMEIALPITTSPNKKLKDFLSYEQLTPPSQSTNTCGSSFTLLDNHS